MWRRVVATGEVIEPAPAAGRAAGRAAVTARVYRGDASALKSGEPVVVMARDLALMEFHGTVVEPVADASKPLQIVVDNPEKLLQPGMLVDVKAEMELPPRLTVPTAAVLYAGKRRIVFVEKPKGTFEPRQPKLGMTSDGLVEIVSGLEEGDQVAISGTFPLAAESRIRSDGTLWGERPAPKPPARPAPAQGSASAPAPDKPAPFRPTQNTGW
jgi:Cu(I)/Ag(I) efflux system membrane fusion protein